MLRPDARAGDQAEVAQQSQLVGHRRLLHADRVGQFGHRNGALPQFGQDQQPARCGQGLQGGGDVGRGFGVEPSRRAIATLDSVSHKRPEYPANTHEDMFMSSGIVGAASLSSRRSSMVAPPAAPIVRSLRLRWRRHDIRKLMALAEMRWAAIALAFS